MQTRRNSSSSRARPSSRDTSSSATQITQQTQRKPSGLVKVVDKLEQPTAKASARIAFTKRAKELVQQYMTTPSPRHGSAEIFWTTAREMEEGTLPAGSDAARALKFLGDELNASGGDGERAYEIKIGKDKFTVIRGGGTSPDDDELGRDAIVICDAKGAALAYGFAESRYSDGFTWADHVKSFKLTWSTSAQKPWAWKGWPTFDPS